MSCSGVSRMCKRGDVRHILTNKGGAYARYALCWIRHCCGWLAAALGGGIRPSGAAFWSVERNPLRGKHVASLGAV